MPADGEVTGYAGRAQVLGDAPVLRQEELEDQRESNHQRPAFKQPPGEYIGIFANFEHIDCATVPPQHGSQVAHAKIALVLETDERHFRPAPFGRRRLAGGGEDRARPAAIHRTSRYWRWFCSRRRRSFALPPSPRALPPIPSSWYSRRALQKPG